MAEGETRADAHPARSGEMNLLQNTRKRKPGPRTVELRVAAVARSLVAGLGRALIVQAIAEQQAKEAGRRAEARRAGAPPDEVEALVPTVWGDEAIPARTVDGYIKRAKETLADEGQRVVAQREYVLSLQLARLNEIYRLAIAQSKLTAATMALREINAMFGMHEAIKVMVLNASAKDATEGQGADLRSDEGRAAAFAEIATRAARSDPAVASMFARIAATIAAPGQEVPSAGELAK